MKEYIDKDLVIQKLNLRHTMFKLTEDSDYKKGQLDARGEINKIILDLPTSDVEPVRHGEWIKDYESFCAEFEAIGPSLIRYKCSICGKETYKKDNFCSDCGAKMDRVINNDL